MRFRNEYYFLSNMYPAPVVLRLNGQVLQFSCSESAFQACKCPTRAEEFTRLSGYDAKALGKEVRLRPDWDRVKLQAMGVIVRAKFQQNPNLAAKLRATGNLELAEDNTWGDTYWGRCNGHGENWLGRTLMAVRSELG